MNSKPSRHGSTNESHALWFTASQELGNRPLSPIGCTNFWKKIHIFRCAGTLASHGTARLVLRRVCFTDLESMNPMTPTI